MRRLNYFYDQTEDNIMYKIVSDEKTLATIKNKDQFLICANFFASGLSACIKIGSTAK